MKGDFSRDTFKPKQHYSAVLMQQGRVQLDADWNEQQAIGQYRTETEAQDVIGRCGAPKHAAGFAITANGADFGVGVGRYYVDGLLCEHDAAPPATYLKQPHLPTPPALTTVLHDGQIGVVYLDVWQRHMTTLDDPYIHEKALGAADTTTRIQTVWQVKVLPVAAQGGDPGEAALLTQRRDALLEKLRQLEAEGRDEAEITRMRKRLAEIEARLTQLGTGVGCDTVFAEWDALVAPSTGTLNARTKPSDEQATPCFVPPKAGYLGLENQLYRVEIHQGGELGKDPLTFKWERNNGALATTFTVNLPNAKQLDVASVGPDDEQTFRHDAWAEVYDDVTELGAGPKDVPGTLIQVDTVDRTQRFVTLQAVPPATQGTAKLRHWNDQAAVKPPQNPPVDADWVALEDGIQVLFGPGTYRTGDYWLIPARSMTGEIEWPPYAEPNLDPQPQPPRGIQHHYCRLALVQMEAGTVKVLEDCRTIFPPLTELDDEREAHKKHNRYLHGWGVVCGLQVRCDDDRTFVRVHPGYALACDGTDLFVDVPQRIDLVERATQRDLLPEGTGAVCLTLRAGSGRTPIFDVQAGEQQDRKQRNPLAQILENTLVMDVINDCILPVVEFGQKQFVRPDPDDQRLVPQTLRRQIVAANLLIQRVNATVGRRVWVARNEHELLEQVYNDARELIESQSYCGMFDDAEPFPAYPASLQQAGITTAFGKTMATQVRVRPDGKMAYVFGGGAKDTLQVFDLAAQELVAELRLPTTGLDVVVQDVVFFARGERLMVAAAGPAGSLLVQYETGGNTQDGEAITIRDKQIMRLHNPPVDANRLYALVKHEGLVRFSPTDFGEGDFAQPVVRFNATGQLELGRGFLQSFAFATAADEEGPATDVYTKVIVIDIGRELRRLFDINLPTPGQDGLALMVVNAVQRQGNGLLYVVVNGQDNDASKRLLVWALSERSILTNDIPLPTSGPVHLASTADFQGVWVALADQFRVYRLDAQSQELRDDRSLPVQMFPMGLAPVLRSEGIELVVVNQNSRTLNSIGRGAVVRLTELETYRDQLLAAFTDVVARFAQYFKDCVCEHLLVDCPECEPNRPVVVACIKIRDNRVMHICNWERREVMTFPKLNYWLSAIPILPLLNFAIERLCCGVLPDFLRQNGLLRNNRDVVAAPDLGAVINRLREFDFGSVRQAGGERVRLAQRHVSALLRQRVTRPAVRTVPSVASREILDREATEVQERLAGQGVVVNEVATYDAALERNPVAELARVPFALRRGDQVNLYTRDGKVVFWTRATAVPADEGGAPAPAELGAVRAELAALRTQLTSRDREVNTLQARLADLRADMVGTQRSETTELREQLAAREQAITTLQTTLETLRQDVAGIGELRQQVERLAQRRPPDE